MTPCQYSPVLLQDTMIGLLGSGNFEFKEILYDLITDCCMDEDQDPSSEAETVTYALSGTYTSDDEVVGSDDSTFVLYDGRTVADKWNCLV